MQTSVSTRTHTRLLPALASLSFNQVSEYSEDLVTHVDDPLLDNLHVVLLIHQPIFDPSHSSSVTHQRS